MLRVAGGDVARAWAPAACTRVGNLVHTEHSRCLCFQTPQLGQRSLVCGSPKGAGCIKVACVDVCYTQSVTNFAVTGMIAFVSLGERPAPARKIGIEDFFPRIHTKCRPPVQEREATGARRSGAMHHLVHPFALHARTTRSVWPTSSAIGGLEAKGTRAQGRR